MKEWHELAVKLRDQRVRWSLAAHVVLHRVPQPTLTRPEEGELAPQVRRPPRHRRSCEDDASRGIRRESPHSLRENPGRRFNVVGFVENEQPRSPLERTHKVRAVPPCSL